MRPTYDHARLPRHEYAEEAHAARRRLLDKGVTLEALCERADISVASGHKYLKFDDDNTAGSLLSVFGAMAEEGELEPLARVLRDQGFGVFRLPEVTADTPAGELFSYIATANEVISRLFATIAAAMSPDSPGGTKITAEEQQQIRHVLADSMTRMEELRNIFYPPTIPVDFRVTKEVGA